MTNYVVEFSAAKGGFCVYRAYTLSRGIKEAGPYLKKSDAEEEAERLSKLCDYPKCNCPFDMSAELICFTGKKIN